LVSNIPLVYNFNIFFENRIPWPYFIKVWILKIFGAKIGSGVVIKPNVKIKYPWKLLCGDHVWIGEKSWIDNLAYVKIKSNVCISQGVYIFCGNHNYKNTSFDLIVEEVLINEGSWLCAKSIVGPGVICGYNSILTVGSVATKNLDDFGIYKGNPAKLIKYRNI
jgi:putative colanic acid biosynthesis acetyltransferase WcaF